MFHEIESINSDIRHLTCWIGEATTKTQLRYQIKRCQLQLQMIITIKITSPHELKQDHCEVIKYTKLLCTKFVWFQTSFSPRLPVVEISPLSRLNRSSCNRKYARVHSHIHKKNYIAFLRTQTEHSLPRLPNNTNEPINRPRFPTTRHTELENKQQQPTKTNTKHITKRRKRKLNKIQSQAAGLHTSYSCTLSSSLPPNRRQVQEG